MIWVQAGFAMTVLSASIRAIPGDIIDSARLDGVSPLQMFRHITIPLMRPTIIFVLIISVIGGFQLFVEPFLLWGGGNSPSGAGTSVGLLIYRTAFTSAKFGDAAAMGVVLAFIIFIVSVILFRLFGGTKALR